MAKERSASQSGAVARAPTSDRDTRLKAALKANLARRKMQARQKEAEKDQKPGNRKPDITEEQ
ncbi:MAG: hypothetical protein AAF678_06930 [Pseudomonadota bacterium]